MDKVDEGGGDKAPDGVVEATPRRGCIKETSPAISSHSLACAPLASICALDLNRSLPIPSHPSTAQKYEATSSPSFSQQLCQMLDLQHAEGVVSHS